MEVGDGHEGEEGHEGEKSTSSQFPVQPPWVGETVAVCSVGTRAPPTRRRVLSLPLSLSLERLCKEREKRSQIPVDVFVKFVSGNQMNPTCEYLHKFLPTHNIRKLSTSRQQLASTARSWRGSGAHVACIIEQEGDGHIDERERVAGAITYYQ